MKIWQKEHYINSSVEITLQMFPTQALVGNEKHYQEEEENIIQSRIFNVLTITFSRCKA